MATFLTHLAGPDAGRPPRSPGRPASRWAFTGLAVRAFGGPLALAAQYAPASVAGASAGAGLAMAGAVAMAVTARFAGHGFAVAVGLGVAVSVAGVMLAEYFALSRLIATGFALYGLWVTIQHSVT